MHPGVIGGIVGSVVGLMGGIIGTYFSIKNTNSPEEKAFVIKAVAWGWIGVLLFLGGLFLLPKPYNFLLWIPYGVMLPYAIIKMNKKQSELRKNERENA